MVSWSTVTFGRVSLPGRICTRCAAVCTCKLSYFNNALTPLTFPFSPLQVIPRPDLEKWLADRVKFHAVPAHREALKAALKKYVNGGTPVMEGEAGAAHASTWTEDVIKDE